MKKVSQVSSKFGLICFLFAPVNSRMASAAVKDFDLETLVERRGSPEEACINCAQLSSVDSKIASRISTWFSVGPLLVLIVDWKGVGSGRVSSRLNRVSQYLINCKLVGRTRRGDCQSIGLAGVGTLWSDWAILQRVFDSLSASCKVPLDKEASELFENEPPLQQ